MSLTFGGLDTVLDARTNAGLGSHLSHCAAIVNYVFCGVSDAHVMGNFCVLLVLLVHRNCALQVRVSMLFSRRDKLVSFFWRPHWVVA